MNHDSNTFAACLAWLASFKRFGSHSGPRRTISSIKAIAGCLAGIKARCRSTLGTTGGFVLMAGQRRKWPKSTGHRSRSRKSALSRLTEQSASFWRALTGSRTMKQFSDQIVPQPDIDRLLEKQWRARVALRKNPFAYALNLKWRRHFAKAKP